MKRFIRRTWRETWNAKEDALYVSAQRDNTPLREHTCFLHVLHRDDRVVAQSQKGNHPRKWDKDGTIVEALDLDQNVVKIDGSGRVIKRNRRFLQAKPAVRISALPSSCFDSPAATTRIPQES